MMRIADPMGDWLNRTHIGDCRELLAQMTADGVRVQTCVTSPPYFGLRDYGTASWRGGDANCAHRPGSQVADNKAPNANRSGIRPGSDATRCLKCGALRVDFQIGLERTPAEYVARLVEVFRLVRQLLLPDGTLWLNLGDCYASRGKPGSSNLAAIGAQFAGGGHKYDSLNKPERQMAPGFKAKDLLGIPWRVAFALQEDGWYLRSDIIEEVELYCPCGCGYILEERTWRWSQDRESIWVKPNAMPESVMDRPTRSHEYVFLLSKSERYYYDAQAIQEPVRSGPSDVRKMMEGLPRIGGKHKALIDAHSSASSATNVGRKRSVGDGRWRNRRSVWTVATTPFSGAHYAVFPRKLIEPCILAGSRPGDVVLEPFMGSGTLAETATNLGRQFIGCELNAKYVELHQLRRTTLGLPL